MALDTSPWDNSTTITSIFFGTTAEEPLDLAPEMRLDTFLWDNSTNATEPPPAPQSEDDLAAEVGVLKTNLNDFFLVLMGAIILFMQVWFLPSEMNARSSFCQ